MSSLKQYLRNNVTLVILTVVLLSFAVLLYLLAQAIYSPVNNSLLPSLFINLSASLIMTTLIIFGIDLILDHRRDSLWKTGEKAALRDLSLFSNMAASYMLNPLGIQVYDYIDPDDEPEQVAEIGIDKMISHALSQDIKEILTELDKSDWENFMMNITMIRSEIRDTVLIYQSVMPKGLLNLILELRVEFKSIDTNAGFFNSIFLFSDNDWNSRQAARKNLYSNFCRDIDSSIKNYLTSLAKLRNMISKYGKH